MSYVWGRGGWGRAYFQMEYSVLKTYELLFGWDTVHVYPGNELTIISIIWWRMHHVTCFKIYDSNFKCSNFGPQQMLPPRDWAS